MDPPAIVEHAHFVAIIDSARLRVQRMNLQLLACSCFHLSVAVEIRKRGVHVVVALAAQELQRIPLRPFTPSRFYRRDKGGQWIKTLRRKDFGKKLNLPRRRWKPPAHLPPKWP